MATPEDIWTYWIDEVGPTKWYAKDDALDAEIRTRFGADWQDAADGNRGFWLISARWVLAYIILTDQFPRNIFREDARAFSTDRHAMAAAKAAIDRDWDLKLAEPERQFFYLPLMHSENLCDQDRCVRLMCSRMPDTGADNLLHARVHREIIRRFGRFPYRNAALGRSSTAAEQDFLDGGGYGQILNEIKSEAAAA